MSNTKTSTKSLTIAEVTENFIEGITGDYGIRLGSCPNTASPRKSLHVCYPTKSLYSYNYKFAYHDDYISGEHYILLCYPKGNRNHSQTTNKHLRGFERAMDANDNCQWFTSIGTYGGYRVNNWPTT